VSPREAGAITRRLGDYETSTRNSQILAPLKIIRDELQFEWSCGDIGSLFDVKEGSVHRIRSQAMRDVQHDTGRPPLLSPDQETEVIGHIARTF
jgi:hypothetical protein